jgi:hypothetical protein
VRRIMREAGGDRRKAVQAGARKAPRARVHLRLRAQEPGQSQRDRLRERTRQGGAGEGLRRGAARLRRDAGRGRGQRHGAGLRLGIRRLVRIDG